MSFGFDYHGTDFDRKRFPEVVHDSEAVVAAFGELIPYVGWIVDWISGHHARTERVFNELDTFFQYVINDHLKPERKKEQDDVIDVLIRTEKEQADLGNSKFTNNTIKGVLLVSCNFVENLIHDIRKENKESRNSELNNTKINSYAFK